MGRSRLPAKSRHLRFVFLLVLLVNAGSGLALAHEFWIEPSSFTPKVGQRVDVALRVGEKFVGEPVQRKEERIERFVALVSKGASDQPTEHAIAGQEGDEPAGHFLVAHPGLIILTYDSNHSYIELEAEKFDEYLAEKGLEAIRKQRAGRNESSGPAREMYSRCAKSLVHATGEAADKPKLGRDRPVGMPLEIVALFDPYAEPGIREGRFRLLFEGRPLPDVKVTAQARGAKEIQVQRSGKEGEVVFRLEHQGPWLIECTHMRTSPEPQKADYESLWASLTFEAPRGQR